MYVQYFADQTIGGLIIDYEACLNSIVSCLKNIEFLPEVNIESIKTKWGLKSGLRGKYRERCVNIRHSCLFYVASYVWSFYSYIEENSSCLKKKNSASVYKTLYIIYAKKCFSCYAYTLYLHIKIIIFYMSVTLNCFSEGKLITYFNLYQCQH